LAPVIVVRDSTGSWSQRRMYVHDNGRLIPCERTVGACLQTAAAAAFRTVAAMPDSRSRRAALARMSAPDAPRS
jgi:hypothetical protein